MALELTSLEVDTGDEVPVTCLDEAAGPAMVAEINRLRKAKESLGRVFVVRAGGLAC